MSFQLSTDFIGPFQTKSAPSDVEPVLQIVEVQQLKSNAANDPSAAGRERHRLTVTDGTLTQLCMLGTQLNPMCAAGQLVANTVIRVRKFSCHEVNGKMCAPLFSLHLLAAPSWIGLVYSDGALCATKTGS